MERIKPGDRISWIRNGERVTGTVVRTHRYGWCQGANTILVLSDDHVETSFDMSFGYERIAGAETLEACRERYERRMAQYPIWAARFADGQHLGTSWGEFEGLGRAVRA